MNEFEIGILGCGSALPTTRHHLASQVVRIHTSLYMIDCGEGTQLQLRKMRLNFNRIHHIFISHLHGDHCFGLPGLISTFALLGRKNELIIHAPKEIEDFLTPILAMFCKELPYKVTLHLIDPGLHQLIMEDKQVSVYSIPLKHRLPTCGFLFKEKRKPPHLINEMINFYNIPISQRARIKEGEDFITPDGTIIPNDKLTRPSDEPRSYAYCSDTMYNASIAPLVKGVSLLYHEATFMESERKKAAETYHSTARQAAEIALKAGAKQLMLGHFSARYENEELLQREAMEVFANTILAKEEEFIKLKC